MKCLKEIASFLGWGRRGKSLHKSLGPWAQLHSCTMCYLCWKFARTFFAIIARIWPQQNRTWMEKVQVSKTVAFMASKNVGKLLKVEVDRYTDIPRPHNYHWFPGWCGCMLGRRSPKRKYSCGACVHNAQAVHSGDQPKNRRVCKRAGNVSWPISVHLCLHWSHFAKICLNQGSKNGSKSVNKNDLLTHGLWILWMLENPCGISFARCSTFWALQTINSLSHFHCSWRSCHGDLSGLIRKTILSHHAGKALLLMVHPKANHHLECCQDPTTCQPKVLEDIHLEPSETKGPKTHLRSQRRCSRSS